MEAMSNTINIIDELIEQGEAFTFNNFCAGFSQYGNPNAYSEEWIVWQSRTKTFINAKFGEDSVPAHTLERGLGIRVLGNGQEKFTNAKTLILSALMAARASIADEVLPEVSEVEVSAEGIPRSNRVFVVHGHDEKAKHELEIFLAELGLEPVVLNRQADEGNTVIEKFEKHSYVGYAFILLTPDELSYLAAEAELPEGERKLGFAAFILVLRPCLVM